MNLQKLFEAQAELDEHIEKKHPRKEGEDRLSKKILALQVELAECAQEWRGFKFWRNDQEPRTEIPIDCPYCYGKGYMNHDEVFEGGEPWPCKRCDGSGVYGYKNPLLEEFVDCLHFILSIGNEIKFDREITGRYINDSITEQFNSVFEDVGNLMKSIREDQPDSDLKAWYEELVRGIIGLGEMLGFSWGQIEDAYFSKNAVNHSRQENGY
ncbi:dUTP diphosphatase [Heyndrickxia coagulans]|uniref:dUTP diphosphatase n=1 Tax=Heyndrickxia coagulans TaxID=1398 RepID=UPI003D20D7DB